MRNLLRCVGGGLALAAVAASAADGPGPRIAVFDVHASGGQGSSGARVAELLSEEGHTVETISDLGLLTLMAYDVVWLFDMHHPGRVHDDWRSTLALYVTSGGSVLQTWHHHVLGQVATGVRRVYGTRGMRPVGEHPAVAGVADFRASFKDHIVERVGAHGTVVLENELGDPVAVAGQLGKGRVISTGLALGVAGSGSRLPRGQERRLLDAFLAWLTPAADLDRMAEVEPPLLEVSPDRRIVAAGTPAICRVRCYYGRADGPEPVVECNGAAAAVLEPVRGVATGLWSGKVTLPTEPARDSEREHLVSVRWGEASIRRRVHVRGVYAPAPPDEIRGVWLHVGADRRPACVMPELKQLGINLAVLRIAGGTAAYYASKVQPDVLDPLATEGGDWLAEAVRHAQANGVRLYPYVNNCVVEGRTSEASLERLRAAGRLQRSPTGDTIDWFCPSQPENVAAIARPMLEIAERYDVPGIQYDFIRYPNSQGCFCDHCRKAFEADTGPLAAWPEDVLKGGPRYDAWVEFRCERISRIVDHISTRIRAIKPRLRISAAVFRNWPACRETNGQDWVRWCREGWLDEVFPMTYTQDSVEFERLVTIHREALPPGFPLIEGVGIRSGDGAMSDPAKVALHTVLARKAGAAGFCGFCYVPGHTAELFGPLKTWFAAGDY